jgi:hypothetical protein
MEVVPSPFPYEFATSGSVARIQRRLAVELANRIAVHGGCPQLFRLLVALQIAAARLRCVAIPPGQLLVLDMWVGSVRVIQLRTEDIGLPFDYRGSSICTVTDVEALEARLRRPLLPDLRLYRAGKRPGVLR